MNKKHEIKGFFSQYGYYIALNLIDKNKIDNLLSELEIIKKKNTLYYSQSEHNWRILKDDLDEFNLLKCSFENFTDILWERKLSYLGKEILQSKEINYYLKNLSNYDKFSIWQNMLFDKSTGTIDHIDSYYLDTNPMGELIACWIALEDINGEGGEFHIYPESHLNRDFKWKNLNHNEFINWSLKASSNYKKKSIRLKKGDVMFWHPMLIHGSSGQRLEGKSRKSLTAHYFPSNFLKGGKGSNDSKDSIEYKKSLLKQEKSYRDFNLPILSSKRKRDIFYFSLKGLSKYIFSLKNSPKKLMNRSRYKEYDNQK